MGFAVDQQRAETGRRVPDHFKLRISPELRQWLKVQAARNLRSMTAEISVALMAYREQVERAKPDEGRNAA